MPCSQNEVDAIYRFRPAQLILQPLLGDDVLYCMQMNASGTPFNHQRSRCNDRSGTIEVAALVESGEVRLLVKDTGTASPKQSPSVVKPQPRAKAQDWASRQSSILWNSTLGRLRLKARLVSAQQFPSLSRGIARRKHGRTNSALSIST